MKALDGAWFVRGNELIVGNDVIPGKIISFHAGAQLQVVIHNNQKLERYRLVYPHYRGTLGGFQELLRDYSPRKLHTVAWAPMKYWEYASSNSRGHRISARNIFSEEVVSSSIRAVKFITDNHATVLTYSERRDVWEVLPLYGTKEEFDDFRKYCEDNNIPPNPTADDNFMRHYKRM